MTRYLLNSGGPINDTAQGQSFIRDIVTGLTTTPRIVMCFFAKRPEEWDYFFAKYTAGFTAALAPSISPTFELATREDFSTQIARCDAVYLHGGDSRRVITALRDYPLPELWRDKVVATNSASSIALATHSWDCDERLCIDGLGILPLKFIAHYASDYGKDDPRGPIDWDQGYKELAHYGDETLPIHALPECDYITIIR